MEPRHILITGNLGYVGPAVSRRLRQAFPAARIDGLDLGFFAHCLTGTRALPERHLDVQYFADIRTITPALLEGVDAIVNLAAISNDPMGKAFERATMEINFEAGIRLANLARTAGTKHFVFASSCSVYGFAEGGPRKETDPLNPLTAYARSKIASEEALQSLAAPGFSVTCLRFPTACGMSDRLRLDLVLNDFVASAVALQRIDILSDGTPWRPLIDTKDMALAISWAVQRDPKLGGAFLAVNVGRNERNYQVHQLAKAVADFLPGTRVHVNKDAPPDKRSYQVDFTRYGQLAPSFLPECTLDDSIRDLVHGLRAMGFQDPDFRNSAYMRLKVLEGLKATGELNAELEWRSPQPASRVSRQEPRIASSQ